jgi:hypothetical protein
MATGRARPSNVTYCEFAMQIDRLRSKLEDLLFKQYPDQASPAIYYGGTSAPANSGPLADVSAGLRQSVGSVINGRVPARIIDAYLRADRALCMIA